MRGSRRGLAVIALLAGLAGPAQAQVAGRLIEDVGVSQQDGYATVTILFGCNVQYVSYDPAGSGDVNSTLESS